MEILFLGVGEACDDRYPNTSLYITCASGQRFLLDCGFTTPHLYFSHTDNQEELDGVWISHFHGDHFFGIPLLLLRFWEMGRKKDLIIAGQHALREKVLTAMELAYPNFLERLEYRLLFVEIEPGQVQNVKDTRWQVEENIHSQRALSLRIDDGEHSLFYSGDGRPTQGTEILAQGCDLVVHEAFWLHKEVQNHGNVLSCLEFARKAGVKNLALVHLERSCRKQEKEQVMRFLQGHPFHVFLPEPGEIFSL